MPASQPKKKLDTLVKLALGVLFGSFALIWAGLFLTRPDRSIPPYSIGSQEGTAVAVHVPASTSDAALETLLRRFQRVGREGRDFGKMKIQPTTPGDPTGPYQRIIIYIFTHDAWAEPEMLHRYLLAADSSTPEDRSLREAFEDAVRGFYRLDETTEEGRIGPILKGPDSAATAAYARVLFKGPVQATRASVPCPEGVAASPEDAQAPAPAPPVPSGAPAAPGL